MSREAAGGRILVAGGDGNLGAAIVKELRSRGEQVRVLSRKPAPTAVEPGLEWVRADVTTGDGVKAAFEGIAVIVNCITSPVGNTYETDVAGTMLLLANAGRAGVKRVFHISIVGIDRIVHPYYQYKLASELAVVESGIPYTIARSAQFHGFLDFVLSPLRDIDSYQLVLPVDMKFQPISTADVASHIAPHIVSGDTIGRLDDFGGPEVLDLGRMAAAWLEIQGISRTIKPAEGSRTDLPFLSSFGDGFRHGYNTNPRNRVAGMTWSEYLSRTYR